MRDRLIELIRKSCCVDVWDHYNDTYREPDPTEELADYLLANGVIVAPMPMADWLRQEMAEHVYQRCMEEL